MSYDDRDAALIWIFLILYEDFLKGFAFFFSDLLFELDLISTAKTPFGYLLFFVVIYPVIICLDNGFSVWLWLFSGEI